MHRKEDTNSPIVIALWFCQTACLSLDNHILCGTGVLPCWHGCSCQRDSKGNLHVLKKGFIKILEACLNIQATICYSLYPTLRAA